MIKKTLTKYLARYAEDEVASLSKLNINRLDKYANCLAVPCYNEDPDFFIRLSEHPSANHLLCICIINCPSSQRDNAKNQVLFKALTDHCVSKSNNLYFSTFRGLDLVVVDRFSSGNELPAKKGVGLARKIACDIACWFWQHEYLLSNIIFSSDADAHLPNNYFAALESIDRTQENANKKAAAYVFDFSHLKRTDAVSEATQVYEKSIKYYREGLLWASSPYAFYTLGSCLAINLDAYCQVRGFPARAGGEDFYLLNKIAKIGVVKFIPAVKVQLEARLSDRAPFGTGPAVAALMASAQAPTSYDPLVFLHLKKFLHWSKDLFVAGEVSQEFDSSSLQNREQLDEQTLKTLAALNFDEAITHIKKQCRSQSQAQAHFHTWFDGFKTLKFIHFLQSNFYPQKSLSICFEEFEQLKRREEQSACR